MPQNKSVAGRDRAAEIDSAIEALTGAAGLVRARVSPPSAQAETKRELTFVYAEDAGTAPVNGWLPFAGAAGELGAEGVTLWVGLGPSATSTTETARHAAQIAGAHLAGGDITVQVPGADPALLGAVVDGLASGYDGTDPVDLLVDPDGLDPARAGILAADTVRLARRLVSAPADVLTPESAARWAVDLAGHTGLNCSVLGPDELAQQGFGALGALGRGSENGPRLVRLTHRGQEGAPVIALVGKGVTFDSGGLSLKSPAAMANMRLDVAGAATVLAVMGALARMHCPVTVHAVLPFAENLPGPGAVRPGDVVTAWNGTQIQVLDSDFEGRVILADALALAASYQPDLLVDLATLTYQAEIALGPEIGAVLARDPEAAAELLQAADQAGEPMWQLPWAPRYVDQVKTAFGVRNHPLHDSGRALTAALFLGEFVPESVPWAHCDMTGPAWAGDASVDGATGFGARTLLRLLTNRAG